MSRTGGYIKIFRGLRESKFWVAKEKFDRRSAWIDLLLRANWKPSTALVGWKTVTIERGQVLVSERNLAKDWRWSRGRVRRFLSCLVRERKAIREPIREVIQGATVLTIINWDLYQGEEDAVDPLGDPRPSPLPARGRSASSTDPRRGRSKEQDDLSLVLDSPLEASENGDELEEWMNRSTFRNRDDLAERRVEAEGCLRLYNDLKGSSVALTPKLFRQYVALWDLWEDPLKILEAVKGLFCDPEGWATKRNLGPELAWKDAEIAERYVAHSRDHWETGGFEKRLEMKRRSVRER